MRTDLIPVIGKSLKLANNIYPLKIPTVYLLYVTGYANNLTIKLF